MALLATACGEGVAARAGTVTLDDSDAGRSTILAVADRLVVDGGGDQPGAFRWFLRRYPKGILSLTASDREEGRFEFVARAVGSGDVVVTGVLNCVGEAAPCPVGANDDAPSIAHDLMFHVRVT